jgi:hypothetical protein
MLATGMEHGMEASYARFRSQVASEWRPMLAEEDSPYAIVEVEPQHLQRSKFAAAFAICPRPNDRHAR